MKSKEELKELKVKLEELNQAVKAAIDTRTRWMDEHMSDFAIAQVGEMLYKREGDNFIRLGVVSELYRYHAGQNKIYDTSMSIEYQYQSPAGSNCYDNTSRQGYLWLANESDKVAHERYKFEELKRKFA